MAVVVRPILSSQGGMNVLVHRQQRVWLFDISIAFANRLTKQMLLLLASRSTQLRQPLRRMSLNLLQSATGNREFEEAPHVDLRRRG
ncbi:MAG TPA: hypothetical protein DD473_22750 [Planctomycetaceae bacterium]|nr:hypothetical protein [Planctomycetaceae bacterium]